MREPSPIRQLIEETFDLVKTHLPDIDVESLWQKVFERTPKWVIQSKVDLTNLVNWQQELLQNVKEAYAFNPNVEAMTKWTCLSAAYQQLRRP